VTGAWSGGTAGAAGAFASASTAPLLNAFQDQLTQSLKDAGVNDKVAQSAGQLIASLTVAGIGAAASGGSVAGAAVAFNIDANNRQLHPTEYQRARQMASNERLRAALSKLEGREISVREFEGRMLAEILRNSDATANAQSGGVADWNLRSIVGCQNLNCTGYKTDPDYANPNVNREYISPNYTAYTNAQSFINRGRTYDQQVQKNVQDNPVSTGIAGAGITALGVLVAGPAALLPRVYAGGVGATANVTFQSSFGNQPTDWVDVAVSGLTGFITGGASTFRQGLTAATLINVGGSLTGSSIKGENPNAGMGGAAVGTLVGYPLGLGVEKTTASIIKLRDPYGLNRPDWIPAGPFGIVKPNPPSVVPGVFGNIGSSLVQEHISNQTKESINKNQGR
jgi:filamentous hemagglutinin